MSRYESKSRDKPVLAVRAPPTLSTCIVSSPGRGYIHAPRPLDVCQIDHTPTDINFVDVIDGVGMFVGRAYLTLLVDVCTRHRRLLFDAGEAIDLFGRLVSGASDVREGRVAARPWSRAMLAGVRPPAPAGHGGV